MPHETYGAVSEIKSDLFFFPLILNNSLYKVDLVIGRLMPACSLLSAALMALVPSEQTGRVDAFTHH